MIFKGGEENLPNRGVGVCGCVIVFGFFVCFVGFLGVFFFVVLSCFVCLFLLIWVVCFSPSLNHLTDPSLAHGNECIL